MVPLRPQRAGTAGRARRCHGCVILRYARSRSEQRGIAPQAGDCLVGSGAAGLAWWESGNGGRGIAPRCVERPREQTLSPGSCPGVGGKSSGRCDVCGAGAAAYAARGSGHESAAGAPGAARRGRGRRAGCRSPGTISSTAPCRPSHAPTASRVPVWVRRPPNATWGSRRHVARRGYGAC